LSSYSVFDRLRETDAEAGRPYGEDMVHVVESVVDQLERNPTSSDRPGMLLGKIQSGKTRTYLGIIAHAIDMGFDLHIVLTKGTKALATQTIKRLKATFDVEVDDDRLRVLDIMSLPNFTRREQRIPLILVVKKEHRNLERLLTALFVDYPSLGERKALIIDDEADYASIGFRQTKDERIEIQTIMRLIGELRSGLKRSSFLQVTATPYALYLQPSDVNLVSNAEFKPVRPAFTELVPIHSKYVGGDVYFDEALEAGSVASYLYEPVTVDELTVLKKEDKRRFKPSEALTSNGVIVLRQAIVNFIVAGIIRRIQSKESKVRPQKYSFVIHTETSRPAHAWQVSIVDSIIDALHEASRADAPRLKELVSAAYEDLAASITAAGNHLPTIEDIFDELEDNIESVQVEKVNSEQDVMSLLDDNGQLDLRNRLNIFIGGQILDRGLTIPNLIGFYYGRRAMRFQQDTVLQHARMYGARSREDLAVTRFYTSSGIYQTLRTIHEFDETLRQAFIRGEHGNGVVFIRQDGSNIISCSPNKILVSTVTSVGPDKALLPHGFQTGYKSNIGKIVKQINDIVALHLDPQDKNRPTIVPLAVAEQIISLIAQTFDTTVEDAIPWNSAAFKATLWHVSNISCNPNLKGHVYLLARYDRRASRKREGGRFTNLPYTGDQEKPIVQQYARDIPMLTLFQQEGTKDLGWRDCPFWWPVLFTPTNMKNVIFASDVADEPFPITDDDEDSEAE